MPINMILHASKLIKNSRTLEAVGLSTCSEAGELAEAIRIAVGQSYKEADDDGVIGEVADVINSAIDAAYVDDPSITADMLFDKIRQKLIKWLTKTGTKIENDEYFGLDIPTFEDLRDGFEELNFVVSKDTHRGVFCYRITRGQGNNDVVVFSLAELQVVFNTISCFG